MTRSLRTYIAAVLLLAFVAGSTCLADEPGRALKVVSHNVWYGFTKKPEPRHSKWLEWMKSEAPDVVSLQELNGYTVEKLATDAKAWGHEYVELLKDDGFSTGITSRYPITNVRRIRDAMHHGLLRCQIEGIWFYVVHFHPSNFERRVEEAWLLRADVATLRDDNPRIVLVGDFNGFSPADRQRYDASAELVPFFRRLDAGDPKAKNLNQGMIDYGGIEAILKQGYVDVIANHRGEGGPFVGTFPSPLVDDEDHGPDRRLDYIFVSPNLLSSVSSASILRNPSTESLSDHFPITATLTFGE